MSYNVHCNTLLDTSRQLLLDGKTLVELIHAQDVEDLDGLSLFIPPNYYNYSPFLLLEFIF